MALARQVIDIPLGGGMDEGLDPRLLPAGKLRRVKNGVRNRTGEIVKRQGYVAKSVNVLGATTLPAPHRLHSRGDSLLALTASALYTYSADQDKWIAGDRPSEFLSRSTPVVRSNEIPNDAVHAYCSGLHFVAWSDYVSGSTRRIAVRILDAVTGAVVADTDKVNTTAIGTISPTPKLMVLGNTVLLFYLIQEVGVGGNTKLKCTSFDTSAVSSGWTAETNLRTVTGTTPCYDVCSSYNGTALVAYNGTDPVGGGVTICVDEVSLAKAVLHSCAFASAVEADDCISVSVDPGRGAAFVAYKNSTHEVWCGTAQANASAVKVEPILQMTPALQSTHIAVLALSDDRCLIFSSAVNLATGESAITMVGTDDTTTPDATTTIHHNITLAARPFVSGSSVYVPVRGGGGDDNTLLAVLEYGDGSYASRQIYNMRTAAVSEMGLAGSIRDVNALGFVNAGTSSSQLVFAQGVINYGSLSKCQGVDLITLDTTAAARNFCENAGSLTAITGGLPQYYDGQHVVEMGFLHAPHGNAATASAGAGLDASSTYSYRFVYEWTDEAGNVYRSAPSEAVTVTTDGAGNAQATLTMRCLTLENMNIGNNAGDDYPRVWIVPYRTEGNGSIHHRLKALGVYKAGWANLRDAASVTYVDSATDASIADNPILYTEGGLLDRQNPGPVAFATMHQQRLWVVGDDRRTIYYSSKILSGEAPWFNRAALSVRIDEGGDITALGSLGDKLLVFKADAVFVIFGDGANDAGGENGLSEAAVLTRECGCAEPRSVVRAANAVWFRSSRGLYRIGADLSVAFVGKAVRDLVDAREATTSATWDAPKGLVYWTIEDTTGSDAVRVVYDTTHDAWSYDELGAASPKRTACACMHGGVYQFADTAGALYYASGWRDAGTEFVPLLVETGPIHVCSVGGYQRLRHAYLLGELQSACGAVLGFAYDDEDAATETKTWTAADMTAIADVRCHMHIAKQKCRTVRAIIYDTNSAAASGEGMRFSMLSLEVGIKAATARTNPAYRK